MRTVLRLILLLGAATIATGCATPYMKDRGRDAADIFTASIGYGGGVKARVGPVNPGLFLEVDVAGFRGGSWFPVDKRVHGWGFYNGEINFTLFTVEAFKGGAISILCYRLWNRS